MQKNGCKCTYLTCTNPKYQTILTLTLKQTENVKLLKTKGICAPVLKIKKFIIFCLKKIKLMA